MREATRRDHVRRVRLSIRRLRDERSHATSSLEELAADVGLSPFHFHRIFRRTTGLGVTAYRRDLRLARAAHRLAATDDRVLDVALGAGYATEDAFRRAFRRAFGRTPRGDPPQESHPMTGIHIGFVKIPVTDVRRSADFFRDLLGLTEDFVVEAYGWAQLSTGSIPLCLYQPGMGGGDAGVGVETGIQFRTDDARALHERLTASGHAPDDLAEGDDGTLSFTARDPDGNRFQIAQLPS